MKTMKSVLIVVAASAAFTVTAAEPLLTPRASGIRHPVIASTGVKDPNLIAGPRLGKATKDVVLVSGSGVGAPNTLAAIKNCPMTPRAKDTAACKKMCEVTGIK